MQNEITRLNQECHCVDLEQTLLMAEIEQHKSELPSDAWHHETLFARTPVFVSSADMALMGQSAALIERVVQAEAYRTRVGARDGVPVAVSRPGTPGVMMGFDFHITAMGPRLIEVNTNAGGAFITESLYETPSVQALACPAMPHLPMTSPVSLAASFLQEWHAAGRSGVPQHIAIVDTQPEDEFLLVDMQLAQIALQALGSQVHIVPAASLEYRDGALWFEQHRIDFVYNRLTDFSLSEPVHQPLHTAWVADSVVLSPSPRHHQLYADKRNLILFGDAQLLAASGLNGRESSMLQTVIPSTVALVQDNADDLWQTRKRWFFKPAAAFGGRAVYSGRKLTSKKWAEISDGQRYIAQRRVDPPKRVAAPEVKPFKFDVRIFTYAGQMQLAVARLYDGQTTNFRTTGGGFAPLLQCEPERVLAS